MLNYPRSAGYTGLSTEAGVAQQPAVLGKVLGLLGFAFLFTAGGAAIGVAAGPGAFFLSLVGSFATLIPLMFLKERAPLNLALLYAFAVFEGMALGLVLQMYIAQGMSGVVVNASASTAAVTLAAGFYGATTKRNLAGLGGFLMVGLLGVVVASIVGIFLHSPALYVGISAVAVLLFTGLIMFDLNRVARARGATEGQAIMMTVSVYLDILNLFYALLRIFGFVNSRD